MVSYTTDSTEFLLTNTGRGVLEYFLDISFVPQDSEVVTFVKDYADWTLEENQDRLSGTVWLTRDTPGSF